MWDNIKNRSKLIAYVLKKWTRLSCEQCNELLL